MKQRVFEFTLLGTHFYVILNGIVPWGYGGAYRSLRSWSLRFGRHWILATTTR